MRIGIISNHHFGMPSINHLLTNKFVAGFAVPDVNNQSNQNIKLIAESNKLPFSIIEKKNIENDLHKWIDLINPDIVFVFSFPYKIPASVLNIPQNRFINFHPSALPAYRGPDPIFWQLRKGVNEIGITAHKMNKNIDAGPIIHIEREQINTIENYGYVENKLSITLLKCVIQVVSMLIKTKIDNQIFLENDETQSSYFKRPTENDLIINWGKDDSDSICNLVRAANPKYMGAITFYKNVPLRIIEATVEDDGNDETALPGTIVNNINGVKVSALDKKIISLEIIYVMEGCYSGKVFQKLFNINAGEKLGLQT